MSEETTRELEAQDPTLATENLQPEVDTQEPISQSPSTPDAGHDDAQPQVSSAASEAQPPEEIEKRAVGKLKQTQEELTQTKQQAEAYKAYILKSPDRVKEALIEVDGYTEQQAQAYVEELRKKNPGLWDSGSESPAKTATGTTQTADPREAAWEVINTHERQKRFWSTLPDLDPSKIDSDQLDTVRNLAVGVEYQATLLRSFNPKMSEEEAWRQGYMILTGKTADQLVQAQEKGRIEGMVDRAMDSVSTMTPASGGQPVKGSVRLSDIESKVAQELGMAPEEYAKWRDQN